MEAYTNLNPVEEEKLQPLKEGVFSLPNQKILDKLSEDDNGKLLYDGNPIVSERETKTYICDIENILSIYTVTGQGVQIFITSADNDMINAEIKRVRIIRPHDETIDLERIPFLTNQVIAMNMNKITYEDGYGYMIFGIESFTYNDIISEIQNLVYSGIEIDYYPN